MIHAPRIWMRKVDDTFTITKHYINDTLNELNATHPEIEFTVKEEENNRILFLDCIIMRNGTKLKTKVYRKLTHTGQYINFTSNQPLHVELSTIRTSIRSAKILSTDEI